MPISVRTSSGQTDDEDGACSDVQDPYVGVSGSSPNILGQLRDGGRLLDQPETSRQRRGQQMSVIDNILRTRYRLVR